jgi:hypothetical protein
MSEGQGITQELSLGDVVSKSFDLYKRDFIKYLIPFLVIEAVIGVATTAVARSVTVTKIPTNASSQQVLNLLPGLARTAFELVALTLIITWIFYPLALGSAVKLASEGIQKGQAELGASFRFAISKLVLIWAAGILAGIIVFLGLIAVIVPGIILGIMFSLVLPVIMLESTGVLGSLGRSRALVSHRWLKTLALVVVFGIIIGIASAVVSVIASPFGVAKTLVSDIISAFYLPLIPIALTVFYYSNVVRISPPQVGAGQVASAATAQTGTKYCPNCGAQLASTASFCPNCGAKQSF